MSALQGSKLIEYTVTIVRSDKNSHGSSLTMLKASQNNNVFSWRLKAAWDGVLRSDSGKRFHA